MSSLFQTALRAFQSNNFTQARTYCEQLLHRNRKDLNALHLLGQIAFARGEHEEAARWLSRCVTLRPREVGPQLMLAQILGAQGRTREAIARYDRALRLQPGCPEAITGKADVLEQSGQRQRAAAVLAPLVSRDRETPEMAVVQGRLDLHEGDHEAVLSRVGRHLEAGEASDSTRAHLLFLAGKALERSGRVDEAFDAYRRGNELMAVSFDEEALQRHTDELIDAFSAERLARLPRARADGTGVVFIIGWPRSGSTLVETIIDAHPDAAAAGELSAMQEIVNGLGIAIGSTLPYPACIGDLSQEDVNEQAEAYLQRLRRATRSARCRVDKYLANYRHLGLIELLLPGARVVHCLRDPLDACLSCYMEPLPTPAHPYTTDLATLGATWRQYDRLMDHWAKVLKLPVLDVQYEAMVADQEAQTRRLLQFLELSFDERCLRYWESGRVARTASYDQVNRPIYGTSVARWRRFERHLQPLRAALDGGP